jgi:hypothetical protein
MGLRLATVNHALLSQIACAIDRMGASRDEQEMKIAAGDARRPQQGQPGYWVLVSNSGIKLLVTRLVLRGVPRF